jgi:hypothetical protein
LLAPKVFDFMPFLAGKRMTLFERDLLLFRSLEAYLALLDDPDICMNAFKEDIISSYAIDVDAICKAGHEILPRVNSGLGVVRRGSMPLEWVEEFLKIPGLAEWHFWRIEQTIYALCATRFGGALLPPEYRVYRGRGLEERPFRHYVGAVRHLMYSEGMRFLAPRLLK